MFYVTVELVLEMLFIRDVLPISYSLKKFGKDKTLEMVKTYLEPSTAVLVVEEFEETQSKIPLLSLTF